MKSRMIFLLLLFMLLINVLSASAGTLSLPKYLSSLGSTYNWTKVAEHNTTHAFDGTALYYWRTLTDAGWTSNFGEPNYDNYLYSSDASYGDGSGFIARIRGVGLCGQIMRTTGFRITPLAQVFNQSWVVEADIYFTTKSRNGFRANNYSGSAPNSPPSLDFPYWSWQTPDTNSVYLNVNSSGSADGVGNSTDIGNSNYSIITNGAWHTVTMEYLNNGSSVKFMIDGNITGELNPSLYASSRLGGITPTNIMLSSSGWSQCTTLYSGNISVYYAGFKNIIYTNLQNNASSSQINHNVSFSTTFDDSYLDSYIFAHNSSGSMTNATTVNIGGSVHSYKANTSIIVSVIRGKNVCGQFWVNNSYGIFNQTSLTCFTVANTPPIVNSSPHFFNSHLRNLSAQINASEADGESLSYYDNTTLFNISSSGFIDKNFTQADVGNWSISISVDDGSVNSSFTFWVNVTNSPPTIPVISTPTANSYSKTSTVNTTASTDADGDAITYRYYVNGTFSGSTTATSLALNMTAERTYAVNVSAFDDADDSGNSSQVQFVFDNVAPTINYAAPSFANASFINVSWIFLNFSFTEPFNNTFMIRNGSTNWTNVNASSGYFFYNFTNRLDGNYTFFGWVNDSAGNVAQTTNRTVYVDTIAPAISFIANTPADNIRQSSTSIFINTSENDAGNDHNELSAFIDFNNSLVGYWRFEDDGDTIINDMSTYGNDGTLTGFGCTTVDCNLTGGSGGVASGFVSSGKRGKAMAFDGVGGNITVVDSSSLKPDYITITAWVYPRTSNAHLFRKYQTDINNCLDSLQGTGFAMSLYTDPGYSAFENTIGATIADGCGVENLYTYVEYVIRIEQWNFLAMTFNGTDMNSYVNGVLVGTAHLNDSYKIHWSSANKKNLTMGGIIADLGPYYLNGFIDEAQIWNRALSPEEINASYQAGTYRLFRKFTGLSETNYSYQAYVVDIAGNMNTTGSRDFTIDLTAPLINNGSNSDNTSKFLNRNNVVINYTFTEAYNDTFYIRNGTEGIVTNTTPNASTNYFFHNFTNLNNANYTFSGWINDTVGNVNTTNNISIVVDTTFPTITLQSTYDVNNSAVTRNYITLNLTVTELYLQNFSVQLKNGTNTATTINITGNATPSWNLINFTNLADDKYNITVFAEDKAANKNASFPNISIFVDTTPPKIDNGSNSDNTSKFVNRNWAMINYTWTEINNNTVLIRNGSGGIVTNTTPNLYATYFWFNFTNLVDGNYTFTGWINDSAGNENSTANITLTVDTVPPTADFGLGSDADNAFLARNYVHVNVTAAENYGDYVTAFLKQGTVVVTVQNATLNTTPGFNDITFQAVSDGNYNVSVQVRDKAGNINTSVNRTVTVDTFFPVVSFGLGSDADGSYVARGYVSFNVTVDELNGRNLTAFLINGSVAAFQNFTVNATPVFNNVTFASLGDGQYSVSVQVRDMADNVNSSATNRTVTVDTTYPAVDFGIGSDAGDGSVARNYINLNVTVVEVNGRNLTAFLLSGSDVVAVQNVSVNASPNFNNITFVGVSDGTYNVSVQVLDLAGNVNATAPYRMITVDTTTSSISFGMGSDANGASVARNFIILNVTVEEQNGRNLTAFLKSGAVLVAFQNVSVNATPIFNNITFLNVADGYYNVTVQVRDFAGNLNTSESRAITVDMTNPLVSIGANANSAGFRGANWAFMNYTFTEANADAVLIRNGTGGVVTNTAPARGSTYFWLNFTSLADANYTFSGFVNDTAGNVNLTGNTSVAIDTAFPAVNFGLGSDAGSSNLSRSVVYLNVTVSDVYPRNLTAFLKNGAGVFAVINVTANGTPGFNNVTFVSVANGWYNVSVYVQDFAGNVGFSENRSFIIDTDFPNVIVYVPAANSSVTGSGDGKQGLALNYSVSDNSTAVSSCWYGVVDSSGGVDVANSTLPNCANITYLNVSKFGTFTLTLFSNDSAGNVGSNITVFSVAAPRPDSGSGSGGGGGGGAGGGGGVAEGSASGLASVSHFYDAVGEGETRRLVIDKAEIALASVAFTAAERLSKAAVSVKVVDESAAPTAASGSVYQYLSIETTNVGKSGIASAEMVFKVEKQWLERNGLDEASVTLNRYQNNAWASLLTSMMSEESSTHFFYRAVSQGFSFFAITASVKPQKRAAAETESAEISGEPEEPGSEVEKLAELRMPAFAGSKEGRARSVLAFSWLVVSGSVFAIFAVTLYLVRAEFITFAKFFAGRKKGIPNLAKLAKAVTARTALFFHRKAEKLAKQKRTVWAAIAAQKAGLLEAVLRRAKLAVSAKQREAESAFSNDTGVEIKMKFKAWPKNKQGRIEVERGVARGIGRREGYFYVSGLMKRLEQTYPGQIRSNQRREIYQEIKEWIDADELCVKSGVHKNVQYYHFL